MTVTTATVAEIRDRILPMLVHVANEYRYRVPAGYPHVVDLPEQQLVGIELDPNYSLYICSDGDGLWADVNYRDARTDNRSSAGRAKFSGSPVSDRRPIDPTISDQALRNLLAELISRWNFQPLIIHITDTD